MKTRNLCPVRPKIIKIYAKGAVTIIQILGNSWILTWVHIPQYWKTTLHHDCKSHIFTNSKSQGWSFCKWEHCCSWKWNLIKQEHSQANQTNQTMNGKDKLNGWFGGDANSFILEPFKVCAYLIKDGLTGSLFWSLTLFVIDYDYPQHQNKSPWVSLDSLLWHCKAS